MKSKYSSECGQIRIYKKAFLQIAESAALEVKGVELIGSTCYGWLAKFLKFFGFERTKIYLGEEVKVVIPITVKSGQNIVDVAYEVQKKVISSMLNNLSIDSLSVDVKIKGFKVNN